MKTAVILNGHIRTWNLCKDNIISHFKNLYGDENVDWFIDIWDTKTDSLENIVNFIKSKNQNVVHASTHKNSIIDEFVNFRKSGEQNSFRKTML